jgi:hypothetical protein
MSDLFRFFSTQLIVMVQYPHTLYLNVVKMVFFIGFVEQNLQDCCNLCVENKMSLKIYSSQLTLSDNNKIICINKFIYFLFTTNNIKYILKIRLNHF